MSTIENTLPQLVGQDGTVVEAVTADDLMRVAGLELIVAEKIDLAQFADSCQHLERIAKEAREAAGAELVRRLDRDGAWTWRDSEFEVKAPSPTAGTEAYDTDRLRAELEQLVSEGTISEDAARKALEPIHPTHTFDSIDLETLRRALEATDEFGEDLSDKALEEASFAAERLVAAAIKGLGQTTYKQRQAGINALKKIPKAAEAILEARDDVEPPARKATVKRVKVSA